MAISNAGSAGRGKEISDIIQSYWLEARKLLNLKDEDEHAFKLGVLFALLSKENDREFVPYPYWADRKRDYEEIKWYCKTS